MAAVSMWALMWSRGFLLFPGYLATTLLLGPSSPMILAPESSMYFSGASWMQTSQPMPLSLSAMTSQMTS